MERVRELVLRHGWNSTSYQILNPGFRRWISAAGDAAVGYVEHGGTCVAAGAPVAAAERLLEAALEFEGSRPRGVRRVLWFGAEERFAERRGRQGERTGRILLGAQPSWPPRVFLDRFHGKASLRAQKNRARNKGLRVREWPSQRASQSPALARCLEEWLATRRLPPMRFLVEPHILDRLHDRRVFVAQAGAGEDVVRGFLVATPVPARHGWLVEEIVRGAGAPNGTAELLLEHAVDRAAALGVEMVTLGLAPLSRRVPGARASALRVRLLLRWARAHGRRFYDYAGLEAFKAKFRPGRWEPVWALAPGRQVGVRDLYAIAGAFSGGAPLRFLARGLARALRQELRWLGAGSGSG